jgi:hypothetical protein
MGGLNGMTKAKARVIDAERPATRFTDVAGYSLAWMAMSTAGEPFASTNRISR